MGNATIFQLTPKTAPVVADELEIWDTAAAQSKKATIQQIMAARLLGTGTIDTGTFALTVPATGTAALRDVANTFTAAQTVAPASTSAVPLTLNSPSGSTAHSLLLQRDGTPFVQMSSPGVNVAFFALAWDFGTGAGPAVQIGRNNNGSTPAAGRLIMQNNAGTNHRLWVDAGGLFRIGTTDPVSGSDTGGTVVGSQSSALAAKNVLGPACEPAEALVHLHHAAKVALRRFRYKLQYNGEEFEGLIVDYAPRYGMDAGRSLNLPTVISDLIQAVVMLAERVEELEGRS